MKQRRLVVIFGVAIVAALLLATYLKLQREGRLALALEPQERRYQLAIADPQSSSGMSKSHLRDRQQRLEVIQGDLVTLDVKTQSAGDLHIHGYGKAFSLAANSEMTFSFRADRAGRYPIEFHYRGGGDADIAALEVQPRR